MNIREIEGLFDTAGEYVDIVKLGWGTSYVTNNLEKKIALYRSFATPVVCGGTLFEAVIARGKLDEAGYRHLLDTGEQDGVIYLVREYAAGSSLRVRLDEAGLHVLRLSILDPASALKVSVVEGNALAAIAGMAIRTPPERFGRRAAASIN